MKKYLTYIIFAITMVFTNAGTVVASEFTADASASIRTNTAKVEGDYRVYALKAFFEKYNSPLTEYADEFVYWADQYQIDWRMVPAITGVESTFGKRIPANSFNAYGWANGEYSFSSWEDSIKHVTGTLKEKYIDKGADTIPEIARRYAPPSTTWGTKVKYFMNKIEPFPVQYSLAG